MIEQRSDGWYAQRTGKATSSNFKTVMGNGATYKNYVTQLALERVNGMPEETYQNAAMLHGTETEPMAREAYSAATDNEVEEAPFVEHEWLEAGASPDGFVGDEGLIEIKCPNSRTHVETLMKGKAPTQYMPQMQGQMWITGRKWCDFVSFDPRLPENAQLFITRVMRDEAYIKDLEERVTQFLQEVDRQEDFIRNYKGGIDGQS